MTVVINVNDVIIIIFMNILFTVQFANHGALS